VLSGLKQYAKRLIDRVLHCSLITNRMKYDGANTDEEQVIALMVLQNVNNIDILHGMDTIES